MQIIFSLLREPPSGGNPAAAAGKGTLHKQAKGSGTGIKAQGQRVGGFDLSKFCSSVNSMCV